MGSQGDSHDASLKVHVRETALSSGDWSMDLYLERALNTLNLPFSEILRTILAFLGLLWLLTMVRPPLSSLLLPRTGNSKDKPSDEKDLVQPRSLAMTSEQKTKLFALIIGIDKYKCTDYEDLKGAIVDVDAITRYLETSLAVPPSNIRTLRNEQATRMAIKQALYDLTNDKDINVGDTILIYYAGHGAHADAPPEWHYGGTKVQMIVPHDCNTEVNGERVHGIPDRTFGALLRDLATEKGDNITVIFDCCYSGSGTRVTESNDIVRYRGIEYDLHVPSDLDRVDWAKRGHRTSSIPPGFIYHGLASHVHLAACKEDQKAEEDMTGGEFTRALRRTLDNLKKDGVSQISHKDLIRRIGTLPHQQPQCEGKHSDRIFLNRMIPIPEVVKYGVRKEQREYILNAGIAQGITEGSKYTIFDKSSWDELGTLTASKPESFETILLLPQGHYPFDIEEEAVAIQIGVGEEEALRLHIAPDADFRLKELMQQVSDALQNGDNRPRKVVFNKRHVADLEAKVEKRRIVFDTLFEPATKHGMGRLQVVVHLKVEDVKPVILDAAHYYWQLRRVLAAQKPSLDCVEFKILEEEKQRNRGDEVKVLVPQGDNLIKDGVVEVILEEETKYGMSIRNKAKDPVYVWVFFFDHGDFAIIPLYRPPIASTTDVPIAPGDHLTIGYGDGGVEPIYFELDEEYKMDVGFVVVVISTHPVDLSDVEQRQSKWRSLGGYRKERMQKESWDTLVIPIVQRRSTI